MNDNNRQLKLQHIPKTSFIRDIDKCNTVYNYVNYVHINIAKIATKRLLLPKKLNISMYYTFM